MKTEIASCKTFGARSSVGLGGIALGAGIGASFNNHNINSYMNNNAFSFHPRPFGRDGSIDALLGVRTGPDLF